MSGKILFDLLGLNGIDGVIAILDCPKLRITKEISLSFVDKKYLKVMFVKIAV